MKYENFPFLYLGNDLARCLRWGGGYEGESIPKLLEKLARSDIVMMDRWNITIETKLDKEENLTIPSHKVLKVANLLFVSLTNFEINITKYNFCFCPMSFRLRFQKMYKE